MESFIIKYWTEFLFGLIITGGTFVVKWIKRRKNIECGLKILMQDHIMQVYDYHTKNGYCPLSAKEKVSKVYKEYTALKGNGLFIEGLYNEIMNLPIRLEDDSE